jgi:hypothetical protein
MKADALSDSARLRKAIAAKRPIDFVAQGVDFGPATITPKGSGFAVSVLVGTGVAQFLTGQLNG